MAAAWMHVATAWTHLHTYSPDANAYAHVQVKPDTVMIELDASRAGKLIAKKPSAGAGAEAGAGAAGDEAGRAPPSSIGRLAGRVLHLLWPYTYCGHTYYDQTCCGRTYYGCTYYGRTH